MRSSAHLSCSELLRQIQEDRRLSILLERVKGSSQDDEAHNLSHLLRVALWALKISDPTMVEQDEAIASALLHDLVNLPKNHPERAKASELSATEAETILKEAGFSTEEIGRICTAIREHSYSRGAKPSQPLSAVIQDADRLEALGAIGLMRVFSTGAKMGAKYFHDDDPWAKHRALDDKHFSVDHFFTKLLHLPHTFSTEGGRAEALRRVQLLHNFVENLGHEIGEPSP